MEHQRQSSPLRCNSALNSIAFSFIDLKPPKPVTKSNLLVRFSSEYDQSPLTAGEAQAVEALWTERLKRNAKLWNGLKFRLHSLTAVDGIVELHLSLTDYKTFQGTNVNPNLLSVLQQRGLAAHGSRRALLAQPLACEVVVETADERIVLVHRSAIVGEYANCIDFPGGHPEPSSLLLRPAPCIAKSAKAAAPSSAKEITPAHITEFIKNNEATIGEALVHELMDSGRQEVTEELNIPSNLLSEPVLLGIVDNEEIGGKPHLTLYFKTGMTFEQIQKARERDDCVDKWEATGLLSFTRKEALEIACGAKIVRNLTPSASGVLSLYRSLILQQQAAPPILIGAEAVSRAVARGDAAVDLRTAAEYESNHLACCAWFPWEERNTIVYLLPARGTPLIVVLDPSIEPPEVLGYFAGLEHRINAFVLATPDLWPALDASLLSKGRSTMRLWSPNAFLKRSMALVEQTLPQGGLAADVACGSGRDAVWIAARTGWSVVALDKDPVLLDKMQQLALREGVLRVAPQQVDLEDRPEAVLAPLYGRCHIVHVSRYLHRPLFPQLKAMVAPGGFVLYHTFMRGCEAFGAPKKPRYLLQPNELKEVFESDFIIHEYTESKLPDRRPVAFLCAQRKSIAAPAASAAMGT